MGKKAVTLLELLISIMLLSLIVFGFTNIDFFSQAQVNLASRRAKLQNEVSFVLSHMAKNAIRAIGNEQQTGANNSVINTGNIGVDQAVKVFIDANTNGKIDAPADYWIAYRRTGANEIRFCPQCNNSGCGGCAPAWGNAANIVSWRIANFVITKPGSPGPLSDNFITATITACWDPATATLPDGTADNPCVNMSSSINMPSVSAN